MYKGNHKKGEIEILKELKKYLIRIEEGEST